MVTQMKAQLTYSKNYNCSQLIRITRTKKLFMLNNISRGVCPQYCEFNFIYVNTVHKYSTRSAKHSNNIITPKCKTNSG